jgi:hypothetical protein
MKGSCASRLAAVLIFALIGLARAERFNQEGRILGTAPVVTNATLFNTPQADAILSAMQIFPVTNAWNEDISRRPALVNSDAMLAQISADLATNRRALRVFQEMNFVLAPDSQSPTPISFVLYPAESDPSPYPIPTNLPVEGWPSQTGALTLQQWQQDINKTGGDRHAIVVEPGNGFTWEMWQAKLTNGNWQAANGAKFDLQSNALRPAGWTSGDAAGLSMFGALPRYDECERGMVEHACRIVVAVSRQEYIYPATHWASTTPASMTNVPAMGQRVRLKSSFVIPASWATEEKAILLGLKKYGALVADNGGFFSISITPDDRWPANAFSHISSVGITNFEVIQSTGSNEGPRSPGAPTASAGSSHVSALGTPINLGGFVAYSNPIPVVQWILVSGPGTVSFVNSSATNTTATATLPGSYVFRISADDGIHAVSYDAVTITVIPNIRLQLQPTLSNLMLSWTGGAAPYVVEQSSTLSAPSWSPFVVTNGNVISLIPTQSQGYFRVHSP